MRTRTIFDFVVPPAKFVQKSEPVHEYHSNPYSQHNCLNCEIELFSYISYPSPHLSFAQPHNLDVACHHSSLDVPNIDSRPTCTIRSDFLFVCSKGLIGKTTNCFSGFLTITSRMICPNNPKREQIGFVGISTVGIHFVVVRVIIISNF